MTEMTDPTRRQVTSLGLLGAALALSGCGAAADLLRPSPPALYTLTPKNTFDADLPRVEWQLLIEQPVAASGLDTARIAAMRSPLRLDYFASVAWSDRAPSMVQTLLTESFENTNRIVSVGRESVGLRADYVLRTELREFQAELYPAQPPRVRVRINAKLVKVPERVIIANQSFEVAEPVASDHFDLIMAGFDEALGKTMRRIVEWTLRTGQADWPSRRRASR